MSATGKSSVVAELRARGYKAVDGDDPAYSHWGEFVRYPGIDDGAPDQEKEWILREDRIDELLSTEDCDAVFVAATARNMSKFYPRFDHIVLLSAPSEVIVERLATRTNNPYGKRPEELADVLRYVERLEPILRKSASHEIDASASLDKVVAQVLELVS